MHRNSLPREVAAIHCDRQSAWQLGWAARLEDGLKALGMRVVLTESSTRLDEGFPILLGVGWGAIERDGGEYLAVDLPSFGDAERFVSLTWNGHGRRGDHHIPEHYDGERWEKYGAPLLPMRTNGKRIVIACQAESRSPRFRDITRFYSGCALYEGATHFRPDPTDDAAPKCMAALGLERATDLSDVRALLVLNDAVGVRALLEGVPVVTFDEGSMAWDITPHRVTALPRFDFEGREDWAHWLAWSQFHAEEVCAGYPLRHILD